MTSFSVERRDLFQASDELFPDYALAHCISADCAMGKGIAVEFKKRYGGVDKLKKQVAEGKGVGTAAVLKSPAGDDKPNVYYLITKPRYYNKPTYETLRASLEDMRDQLMADFAEGVLMPKIGCGLDGLKWEKVEQILREVFSKSDVKVLVCYI